jgi:hypothetical protein
VADDLPQPCSDFSSAAPAPEVEADACRVYVAAVVRPLLPHEGECPNDVLARSSQTDFAETARSVFPSVCGPRVRRNY